MVERQFFVGVGIVCIIGVPSTVFALSIDVVAGWTVFALVVAVPIVALAVRGVRQNQRMVRGHEPPGGSGGRATTGTGRRPLVELALAAGVAMAALGGLLVGADVVAGHPLVARPFALTLTSLGAAVAGSCAAVASRRQGS